MRSAASLGALCLLLLADVTVAQVPLEVNGLRGGRHVGSALPVAPAVRISAGVGYAHTEGVLDAADRHHRAGVELAAAYTPWPALQLSLALAGRHDVHRGAAGDDRGSALSAALTTRHAVALTRGLALAGQARLHFPAAASARRGLSALSPELALLLSSALPRGVEASLLAGYRIDRSLRGLRDPDALSAADLLAASVSRYDAALLGALLALSVGPLTTTLEWSWDLFVGAGAPAPGASPLRIRLGAQLPFRARYVASAELGVSPSARPDLRATHARIEPRAWASLALGVLFTKRSPAPTPPPAPVLQPAPPPAPEPVQLEVRVVDPTSAPIAGARVALAGAGEQATDADGVAMLDAAAGAMVQLTVHHPRFEARTLAVHAQAGRQAVGVTLEPSLPDGEIKGKVRSLRSGRAVSARIAVEPLALTLETDAGGQFAIPVPPGEYTLEIVAPGHEPQRRTAKVEHRGVTILVVDLRRSQP